MPSSEYLVKVADGSDDIAVGISGFGSARIGPERWDELARLTGRTTFVLQYEAQEMPWEHVPTSLSELGLHGGEIRRRWVVARLAAAAVSTTLAGWIDRWTRAGRKVLIVGFSLGGYVAWRAAREAASKNLDVILISAAIGDKPKTWENVENVGHFLNVFSREDLALKWLYPMVVGGDETPAAGLGPIVAKGPNIENIDVTDYVGKDHLWASQNLSRLVRLAIGCLWGASEFGEKCPAVEDLPPETIVPLSTMSYARLLRWMVADPRFWETLGKGLEGDPESIWLCHRLDRWSLEANRLPTLLELGRVARVLSEGSDARVAAARSYKELSGILRLWFSVSGPGQRVLRGNGDENGGDPSSMGAMGSNGTLTGVDTMSSG